MSAKLLLTLLACSCLVLLGCTRTASVDKNIEAETIRNIDAEWTRADQAGDVEKIVGLAAPDIIFLYPKGAGGSGQEAFRRELQSWLADTTVARTYTATLHAVEVSASGDLAYTRGTAHWRQTTPTGFVDCPVNWVTVYRKIEGKWRAVVDISTPSGQ